MFAYNTIQHAQFPICAFRLPVVTLTMCLVHDSYSNAQRQTAVTAYLKSKQLPLFDFAGQCGYTALTDSSNCLLESKNDYFEKGQTAVTAYFTSK